ncbi:MAG: HDIG domain-containing protein [Treponema sp.]|jgi:putative nucleotidyltransferase with HDIG domain|nr:HDIG domain-containing protein [Treponema sp.]
MKRKINFFMINFRKRIFNIFQRFRSGPVIYSFALFIAAAFVIIINENSESISDISDFEAGRVADRDVVAGFTLSFVDEEATRARTEAAAKHVNAVFRTSTEANKQILDSWNDFCDFTGKLSGSSRSVAIQAIEAEYPGSFSNETLGAYLSVGNRTALRNYGIEALNLLLNRGIFLFHREDIRFFNPDIAELQHSSPGLEREYISYNDIITLANARNVLGEIVKTMDTPILFKAIAVDLLEPFVKENTFFSFSETQKRIEEAKETISPVNRTIEKGNRIIRKGFIITEEEMEDLTVLHLSMPKRDPRSIIGVVLVMLLLYILFIVLSGKIVMGREINNSERYLLASITGFYIIGSVLLFNFLPGQNNIPISLLVPTALFVMLIAVFMGTRPAMIMALAMPLGSYFAGAFDNHSYIFTLISGIAASTVLHNAKDRMSLIRAGILIAAANSVAIVVILLMQKASIYDYPAMIFGAVLNGIVSGMLTLGFLPPLEHALNAVTPFRLMELSDLNAPVLRKLFTAAPGTYSHSLMVANLSEQACQDIGANALLARVGAYYHDIGKIENPAYFVENQTEYNKHDDIAPRLSATIIRSHVKLGVEKAISLGLPKDVINIIAEHHGNSVISWFYNKAAEQEIDVSSEDFCYPGPPPRTRESAVVMLADITEAAVRTLDKPTAGKIDKFVQQLFDNKIEHGQLAESELSFRELEIIKKAFVKALTGYYHSRIEYPKQKEEA